MRGSGVPVARPALRRRGRPQELLPPLLGARAFFSPRWLCWLPHSLHTTLATRSPILAITTCQVSPQRVQMSSISSPTPGVAMLSCFAASSYVQSAIVSGIRLRCWLLFQRGRVQHERVDLLCRPTVLERLHLLLFAPDGSLDSFQNRRARAFERQVLPVGGLGHVGDAHFVAQLGLGATVVTVAGRALGLEEPLGLLVGLVARGRRQTVRQQDLRNQQRDKQTRERKGKSERSMHGYFRPRR